MKERRKAGATHSFRLTMEAAQIVDEMIYPRRLGGKSRRVSDAIVAFFGARTALRRDGFTNAIQAGGELPSYDEVQQKVAALQEYIRERGESEQQLDEDIEDIDHLEAKIAELRLKNGENDPPSRGGKGMFSWLRRVFHW